LLTDRDGLFGVDGDGRPTLIGDVPANLRPEDVPLADMRGSGLGRGGVSSKIAAASMATAAGVTCVIASGSTDGVLAAVASGHRVGTRFAPSDRREPAFKLWLRYAKPTLGRIRVDAGAAQALRRQGTSLLPVGVREVDGGFAIGDAIEVDDLDGRCVGKGISGFAADDLRQVVGLKTEEIQRVLPDAGTEVIHRDQFVLYDAVGPT
jgi:glutamate 5-kinase